MKKWFFRDLLSAFVFLSFIAVAGSFQTQALAARSGGRGSSAPVQNGDMSGRQQVPKSGLRLQGRVQTPEVRPATASRDQRPTHDPLVPQLVHQPYF